MKLIISALTLLSLLACGPVKNAFENQPDPDTLDAIRKSNHASVEGVWGISVKNRHMYLEIAGSRYKTVVWEGDTVMLSDQGSVNFDHPGRVIFNSENEGCSAPSGRGVYQDFRRDEGGNLQLLSDTDRSRFITMVPINAIETPPAKLCMWDFKPSADDLSMTSRTPE